MKKNCLIITHEYPDQSNFGGIATFHGHLSKVLTIEGHNVSVLANGQHSKNDDHSLHINFVNSSEKLPKIYEIICALLLLLTPHIAQLLRSNLLFFKKFKTLNLPSGSFIHTEIYHSPAFLIALLHKKKHCFIFHSHGEHWLLNDIGNTNTELWLIEMIENFSIKYLATYIICCSKDMLKKINKKFPSVKTCIHIQNPISLKVHLIKKNSKINLNTIIYFGRLEYRKGIDLLIQAFVKLNKEFPKTKLIVVGDSGEGFTIKDRSVDFFSWYNQQEITQKAKNNIHFIGQINEREKLFKLILKLAGIIILPARYEPFGYTTLEAIYLNQLVLCSNAGGGEEIISKNKDVLLCETSAENLIKSYKKILQIKQEKLLKMIKENKSVLGEYSYSSVGSKYTSLYKKFDAT